MFYFPEPGDAVLAAVEMVEMVRSHGLPPAHVGIHAGPVVFQEGDYFGRTVNIAARIAEYARQGEVLVSQEVVDGADGRPVTFTEIGLGSSIGSTTERPTAVLAASDYYARRPAAAAGLGHTISRKKLVESSHQVIRQRRRNRPSNIRWRAPYDFLLVLEGQLDLRAV